MTSAPTTFGADRLHIAASVTLLNLWDMQGEAREAARNNWAVNVGVIGGLLLAAAQGF